MACTAYAVSRCNTAKATSKYAEVYINIVVLCGSCMWVGQPVNVMLNVGITVSCYGHGIVSCCAQPIGCFPKIGHTVIITIQRLCARRNGSITVIAQACLRLAGV